MTYKYPIAEPQGCYLLTLNTIDRVDLFIRPFFKQIIVESLKLFYRKERTGRIWVVFNDQSSAFNCTAKGGFGPFSPYKRF